MGDRWERILERVATGIDAKGDRILNKRVGGHKAANGVGDGSRHVVAYVFCWLCPSFSMWAELCDVVKVWGACDT